MEIMGWDLKHDILMIHPPFCCILSLGCLSCALMKSCWYSRNYTLKYTFLSLGQSCVQETCFPFSFSAWVTAGCLLVLCIFSSQLKLCHAPTSNFYWPSAQTCIWNWTAALGGGSQRSVVAKGLNSSSLSLVSDLEVSFLIVSRGTSKLWETGKALQDLLEEPLS